MKVCRKILSVCVFIILLSVAGFFVHGYEGGNNENIELPGDGGYREMIGSSYWTTSNLREWLNSADEVVKYTCQSPSPDKLGNYAYDDEPGFLHEFSQEERDAIAVTKHRVILANVDAKAKTGGNVQIAADMVSTKSLTFSVPNLISNGLKYNYQEVLDKVYILNTYELYVYVQQRGYNLEKSLMQAAKERYSYYNDTIGYWLASACSTSNGEWLHVISAHGTIIRSESTQPRQSWGVVPVINLKPDYRFPNGKLASELQIGEIVTFGKYLGEPIKWRVINKQDGYPMLWAEEAVSIKAFDAPGDVSLKYSNYLDFTQDDFIDRSIPVYVSSDGSEDVTPPTFVILNEEDLFTRQNGEFTLHFEVTDESKIEKIILPNGQQITDTSFSYTFSSNGYYMFIAWDIHGNYRYFIVPVGNVNLPATVEIQPSANGWTNKDVTVDIFTTCDVGFEIAEFIHNYRGVGWTIWPNYTTYAQKQIRITGYVELVSADKPVGDVSVGIGVGILAIGKSSDGFTVYPTWLYGKIIPFKTLQEEGKQYFDFIYTVPSNYFANLYPHVHINNVYGYERGYTLRWTDLKYELLDKEDLKIDRIILPDGREIIGESSYRDILTEEGEYKYTVIDNRGMVYEKIVKVLIDKVSPTIDIIPDKTLPTNQDVVLTVIASDDRSGVKQVKLPNGSTTSSTNITFNVRTNGDYTFEVTDIAGNVTRKTFKVSNIDKIPPQILTSYAMAKSSDSVLVYVVAEDVNPGSGLDEEPYRFYRDGNLIKDWNSDNLFIDTGLLSNTLYEYAIEVRDLAGNVTKSDNVFVYTLANQPSNVEAKFDGTGIIVTWDSNGNPSYTKYEIEYTDDSTINSIVVTGTIYKIQNIQIDKQYKVRMRAINEDGVPSDYTEYINVNMFRVGVFRITNVRDIRWKNYTKFPITEFELPLIEKDGLTIGLGYGIDFEIDTEGFGGQGDRIVINVAFEDMAGNPLNLYVKDSRGVRKSLEEIDSLNNTQYTKVTLTAFNRILISLDNGVGLYRWKGYYFLPFTIECIDGTLPDSIMVIFDIRAEKETGEVVKYGRVSKVFRYVVNRTAYDDVFIDRLR